MKKPFTIDEVLEAMWNVYGASEDKSKSAIFKAWRRLLRKGGKARHLAVLHLGNGHYMVESEYRPGQVHALELHKNGEIRCTCEDATIRKRACKHIALVARLREEGTLP